MVKAAGYVVRIGSQGSLAVEFPPKITDKRARGVGLTNLPTTTHTSVQSPPLHDEGVTDPVRIQDGDRAPCETKTFGSFARGR